MNDGAQLQFIDCDKTTDILRDELRRVRDAYRSRTGELPETAVLAGGMMLALREGTMGAGALAAMYVGLRLLADEVLTEAKH